MEDLMTNPWYQEATIEGVKMPFRRSSDTNERRWKGLIEPLVPFTDGKDRLFVELGSNAGFYLRKMAGFGFKTIGVEKENEFVTQARYWEEHEPMGTVTLHKDLNDYDIPACQVLLLANVHYWLDEKQMSALVHKLKRKVLYVIVVGRFRSLSPHKSPCDLATLKKWFRSFVQGETTQSKKHFCTVFRNPRLVEKDTHELGFFQQLMKSKKFLPEFEKFIDQVLDGKVTGLDRKNGYYKYLSWRGFPNRKKIFIDKIGLVKSVAKHGILIPLVIGRRKENGKYNPNLLYDGDHRYILARKLGIDKILCRVRA
jgi:hypothetical protein